MKLSVVTLLAASLAVTAAFAPAARNVPGGTATATTTVLRGAVSGEDVRHARPMFAPGHFETHGAKSSAGREQISGEDVRHARPKFAPGHFETHGAKSAAVGREQCPGEDVREGRGSYAPFDHRGRVGKIGEIGTDGSAARPYVPASGLYVQPRVSPEFAPSFESGLPAKAAYGFGGGGKKAAGTSTGAASGYLGNL